MNTQRNINSAILPSIPEDSVWISILDFLYESYSARKFIPELFCESYRTCKLSLKFLYESYSARKFIPELFYESCSTCKLSPKFLYESYSTRKLSPEKIYKSYRVCNIGGVCRGCSYF